MHRITGHVLVRVFQHRSLRFHPSAALYWDRKRQLRTCADTSDTFRKGPITAAKAVAGSWQAEADTSKECGSVISRCKWCSR